MQAVKVLRARDCGVSVVLAKPVQPAVLFDRLAWLVRDRRAFIDVPANAVPTGASSSSGRRQGAVGCRGGDVPANLGPAKKPDMQRSGVGASPLAATA